MSHPEEHEPAAAGTEDAQSPASPEPRSPSSPALPSSSAGTPPTSSDEGPVIEAEPLLTSSRPPSPPVPRAPMRSEPAAPPGAAPGPLRSAPPRPSLRSEPPRPSLRSEPVLSGSVRPSQRSEPVLGGSVRPSQRSEPVLGGSAPQPGARGSSRPPASAGATDSSLRIPSAPPPARFPSESGEKRSSSEPPREIETAVLVRAMKVISVPPDAIEPELPPPPVPRAGRLPFDAPGPIIETSEVGEDDIEDSVSPVPVSAQPVAEPLVEPETLELESEPRQSKPPEELESLDDAELAEAPAPPPPPRRKMKSMPPSVPSAAPAPPGAASPAAAAASSSNFPAPPKRPPRTDPDASATDDSPRSAGATPATRRRPWWEIMFGEDFARAEKPLSPTQVKQEVDFMLDALGLAPGAVILDLCCGQGLHAVELASRGYGVVGYDLSVYQLAIAGDNAQARHQKINFLQGDIREMAFEQMFDAVVCWDSSFGYFEEEKNYNVAERIFRALRPGGILLLDVLNRDYAAASSPNHVWFEGDGAVCMDDMSVDWITSRLRVKRSLILDDGRSRECNYSLRLYNLHELGKLLHDVGFRVTQASGHIATPGVFFGPCSPRIIMRAQKPE